MKNISQNKNYIKWFDQVDKDDIALVGGKGANLGEMLKANIPIPYGFVVTVNAYYDFLKETNLDKKIKNYLSLLDHQNPKILAETAQNIQKEINKTIVPKPIALAIMKAYLDLNQKSVEKRGFKDKLLTSFKLPYVAVRSSATAEDLPTASFAGQQETFLNVRGETNVVLKVKEAWASLFTARAIFYRQEQKFDHFKVGIAVPVQLMVNSEASGVMFTIDPVTNNKNRLVIEAIFGLGELIVQGAVTPDHYEIDKQKLDIVVKKINAQEKIMVRKNGANKEFKLSAKIANRQKISDETISSIANYGLLLEKHYYFPQDIEWAVEKGKVYIVQTRPITTINTDSKNIIKETEKSSEEKLKRIILTGNAASPGIASGPVKLINKVSEIDQVLRGDILVTLQTNPDFVPSMKRAVAIVTERGGRTSHAAIVSRELGIPAIVGAKDATSKLKTGMIITVNGSTGAVYQGSFTEDKVEIAESYDNNVFSQPIKTATKVYVNCATPDRASDVGKMDADGIGLLRAEFMIADIGIHPRKLINEHKENIFIDKLASDLVKFCQSFNPRPVVYRATDFKTNEYCNLIGGKEYEPEEANPMLGYRGAYRYMSDPRVFQLELETIKKVRNEHGFKNLWLMLPFVRTVKELVEVKKIIADSNLLRSPTFKLWMMVEIPSNVILIDKFCQTGIDGVSIGSNDLTMLILGTDRDNKEVATEFDERNEAVLWAIERVIKTCHKYKVTTSICGQAPSDYPDLVEKLVSWGITSISVNPDAIDKTRKTIYEIEQKLSKKSKRN